MLLAFRKRLAHPLLHALLHPVQWARERLARFWLQRLTPRDRVQLTQRNVYILPTRPGVMLALTLVVLLLASINFQLNLGYVLTFLLTGCALVSMHVAHANLRGLELQLLAPQAQFAGSNALLTVRLLNARKSPRWGIALALMGSAHWSWTDVAAQGSTEVQIAFRPQRRGLHALPAITAETRFPLGTFRVWTVWRVATQLLVYPAPEVHAPPFPAGEPGAHGAQQQRLHNSGEYDGVRQYRRGDPLKLVLWKKAAKSDTLVSRDAQQAQQFALWLDYSAASVAHSAQAREQRLARLCAWVLRADQLGLHYGLRLPGVEIAPGSGDAQRRACLQALALF